MRIETEGVVVGVRAHAEHGAVVRIMTDLHGLLAGYVRGGRSTRLRPILIPGNIVRADLRARTEAQLAAMTVELVEARTGLLGEPLAADALAWTTALVASALPEGQPYRGIFAALTGLLDAIAAAPSARGWADALLRFEQVVLAELGYGREERAADLAATGRELAEHVLPDRSRRILVARERLIERLQRAVA